jgi:hypothetical protein
MARRGRERLPINVQCEVLPSERLFEKIDHQKKPMWDVRVPWNFAVSILAVHW